MAAEQRKGGTREPTARAGNTEDPSTRADREAGSGGEQDRPGDNAHDGDASPRPAAGLWQWSTQQGWFGRHSSDDDRVVGGAAWRAEQAGLDPVRKPDPELLRAAVAALELPGSAVVMVGDQYFTDIAGAGLAGIRSIKVPTIGRESFPTGMRVGHVVERLAYRIFHGKVKGEG